MSKYENLSKEELLRLAKRRERGGGSGKNSY